MHVPAWVIAGLDLLYPPIICMVILPITSRYASRGFWAGHELVARGAGDPGCRVVRP